MISLCISTADLGLWFFAYAKDRFFHDYAQLMLVLVFDPILFILAGNEDMHKISDEFEFRPDRTTD